MIQCRRNLPQYMIPLVIAERSSLPRNANGKIDRKSLAAELADAFRQEHT
jgi:acyl-CoA synthetase (AMP-forming)/AMP-acid ligase II